MNCTNITDIANILNGKNEDECVLLLERLKKINNYLSIDIFKNGLVNKYDFEFNMLKLDEPTNNLHIICNQNIKIKSHFQKYFEYFGFKNLKINIFSESDDECEENPEGNVIVDIIKIEYKKFVREYQFCYCCNDMDGDNLVLIFNSFMCDYISSYLSKKK